ncbi:hypothetical protein Vadar_012889 [Vaccinium darrowii]|uniref:Uncharacterized protein n=1 Tax=Vaccinium darrowii TaxID=229202 RepID=A0ACB7ZK13_9ERIC|nr:hypothetical protein Vadar_012889 [Vaccinium darrowii]
MLTVEKKLIDEIHGRKEEESETLPTAVFELLGEPAIVIKGIPPLPPNNNALVPCDIIGDANSNRTTGFGEWLKGREVRKLFGEQFYTGKVTKFDKEAGWYKVVYDDGDFEDLEWHELQEVLLPRSGCYYPVESISSEDH